MPSQRFKPVDRRTLLAATAAGAVTVSLPLSAIAQGTAATMPPAPKPADWARLPNIRFVDLSPDGKHICYVSEKDAVKYLYTFDLNTNQAQSYNMGQSDIASLYWLDNEHILVTGLLPARYTTSQNGWKGQRMLATVFNLTTTKQNPLYSNMPVFEPFVYSTPARIKIDGKTQVAALAGKKDASDSHTYLYRFELDGTKSWEMDQATNATDYLLTPDGEMIARECYDWVHRRWSIDYHKDGVWKEICHFDVERRSPSMICLAGDGQSLIVSMPSDGEINDIRQLSPDGTLSEPLVEHGSNRYPTTDPVTYRHNGYTRYDGWQHYEYSDPVKAGIAAKAQKAMGDYRMLISAEADNPNQTVLYSEGEDDAGTYYYIDFAGKKPLEIGRCYPDIPFEWISSKQLITYKASDGLDIPAYLTLPPNRDPKALPLIVYPHPGPASSDGIDLEWTVEALASSGYAVLQPNYRGSTRYGEAFIAAGKGEWAGKCVSDLSDGVAALVTQGIVDARKVAILGIGGYAGYMALAGASLASSPYNCSIAEGAISDIQLYRMTNIGNETSPGYRYFRAQVGEKTDLDSISPARRAASFTAPVLLIHSEEETTIDIKQSRTMASALKSAGKTYELIEFKAEDNWGLVEKSRIEFINYVIDFLAKHNPA